LSLSFLNIPTLLDCFARLQIDSKFIADREIHKLVFVQEVPIPEIAMPPESPRKILKKKSKSMQDEV
jgi:predicted GIY-YIG superfamily endonuclease